MQLDELLENDAKSMTERDFSPLMGDELAYIALCGFVGQLPDQRSSGAFQMGALIVRYQWKEGRQSEQTAVLTHPSKHLVVINAELIGLDFELSAENLVHIWRIVQEHGDSIVLGGGDARARWIEGIANQYHVTASFVQNLLKLGPQLRRLLS